MAIGPFTAAWIADLRAFKQAINEQPLISGVDTAVASLEELSASSGGAITVEDEGIAVVVTNTVNFSGAGVTVIESPAGVAKVIIPGGLPSDPLTVDHGGTGVATLSGIPFANGTSPFIALTIGTGLTLAGSTLSVTTPFTTPVTVPQGGTGQVTLTNHGVLVGAGVAAVTSLAVGATNTVLHGNTGADPSFSSIATGDIANAAVTLAKIQNAAANSILVGSGAAGAGSSYVEIALGTNLSMTGTTLNATGGGASFANPTAVVGLAVVNGVATTAMRSDAAPPLSQAIAPTWTGAHTFTPAANSTPITISGYSLTGAATTPLLSFSGTVNTSGNLNVIDISITNTSLGASSNLLSIKGGASGSTTEFKIDPVGNVTINGNLLAQTLASTISLSNTSLIKFGAGRSILGTTADSNFRFQNAGATQSVTLSFPAADGVLQHGAADAAAPVAQTIQVQSVVAGTANTAGANLTISGSKGTGTGAGGQINVAVAPAGGAGSTQNALVNYLTIDPVEGVQIKGTTTNSTAAAGFWGELITSTVPIGSAVALTANVAKDITSISVTPGRWDISAIGCLSHSATSGGLNAWVSTTSATDPGPPNNGAYFEIGTASLGSGSVISAPTGMARYNFSVTTTVYLSVISTASAATTGFGFIRAMRVG